MTILVLMGNDVGGNLGACVQGVFRTEDEAKAEAREIVARLSTGLRRPITVTWDGDYARTKDSQGVLGGLWIERHELREPIPEQAGR